MVYNKIKPDIDFIYYLYGSKNNKKIRPDYKFGLKI